MWVCVQMGLEMELVCVLVGREVGKSWRRGGGGKMYRDIGGVYLDLIMEVCCVLCLTGSLCYSFFEKTSMIDISTVYWGLKVILWLVVLGMVGSIDSYFCGCNDLRDCGEIGSKW